MGIASGTVNQFCGGFCKFSVTFCVDKENTAARLDFDAEKIGRGGVFPLEIGRCRGGASGPKIFLTEKFRGRAGGAERKAETGDRRAET
jgi:hypothetical protein